MRKATIVGAPESNHSHVLATIRNTRLSQRDTLEEIIVNLATALGISRVHRFLTSSGSYVYEVQAGGFGGYQSASNTILDLSRALTKDTKS